MASFLVEWFSENVQECSWNVTEGGGVLEVGKLALYAITRSCGWGQTIRLEKLVWTDLIVSQSYGTFVELSIDMFENLVFLMKSRWWLFGYILILLKYEANYHCP